MGLYSYSNLYGTFSSSASQTKVTLLDDQCPRQVMLQTGWTADRARRTNSDSYWTCSSTYSQVKPSQQCAASFLVPLPQSIFKTLVIWGKLLQYSAGSSPLTDVNYPETNDSNTPENSPELSDIPLPCRSSSFKCKSAYISPRQRNSSVHTYCISNW